MLIDISVWML